ncbi:MAG: DegV family protein [Bacilli bacterium]|nr:DegV family protein [Bacilli bacterium]
MNQKIAILTDSSSSVYAQKHSYEHLFMIDLPCFLGEETFTNFEKNQDEPFFTALSKSKLVPKTSQPSVGEMLEKYNQIKKLGYTHIIFLPISRELSGTFQNAHLAKEIIKGIEVIIVDTLTTASILLHMALEAAKQVSEGKGVDEVLAHVEKIKSSWGYYLTVNDLSALIKNGRLSNAKGFVANILRIKPVIHFNREGKLVAIQNVRTFKSALLAAFEKILPEIDPENGIVHLSCGTNEEDVQMAYQMIREKLPHVVVEQFRLPATIVAHVGLTAIGLGYINPHS